MDGRGSLVPRGVQVAEAGASHVRRRVEEPHREDESDAEGQAGELRRPLPVPQGGV